MRLAIAALVSLASIQSNASENWNWSEKIAVSAAAQAGVFHHLDGSGRKHIAVSNNKVAVVWEDESSTAPQIYIAEKTLDEKQFSQPIQLSAGNEAYEPSVAALGNAGFLTVYEEDSAVYARFLTQDSLSKSTRLSTANASHAGSASIAAQGDKAFVIWREKHQNNYRLLVTSLTLKNNRLIAGERQSIEPTALQTPVLKPVIAAAGSKLFIAWEDRREGHTRLLYSFSDISKFKFSDPENLNEFFSGRNEYDKGSGVTRLSMSAFAGDELLAAWMDKRRGGLGYGIFAAFGSADDESFGPNEKVHGEKGDQQPHYNPSVTGNAEGDFAVAWDDFRNGDLDIWLSSYNDDDEWSDDYSPEIASGPGEQSHASVVLDDKGGLHLVWISREDTSSPTRLWYGYGAVK